MAKKLAEADPTAEEVRSALIYAIFGSLVAEKLCPSFCNIGRISGILTELRKQRIIMEENELIEHFRCIISEVQRRNPNISLGVYNNKDEIMIQVNLVLTPDLLCPITPG
jgi:hypothetical protein